MQEPQRVGTGIGGLDEVLGGGLPLGRLYLLHGQPASENHRRHVLCTGRVRALPPDSGGRVPAIAVTAFTRPEERARALRAGYTAHVGKPIDSAELVTLASNVMTQLDAP